jgi:DNA-binding MarR family transcriptional regulator
MYLNTMRLEEEIKQEKFRTEFSKSIINLIYTSNYLHQLQLRWLKPHGLTIPQYNVLRILRGQYPKPSTVNLIIERMLDKSSNASRIVDKLESKSLVERKQCAEDRRAVDVYISQGGLDLLAQLDSELVEWEDQICHLDEVECKSLNDLLDKFRNGTKVL